MITLFKTGGLIKDGRLVGLLDDGSSKVIHTLLYLYFVNTLLKYVRGVKINMGDVIITRRRSGGGSTGIATFITKIIESDGSFIVPEAINNEFDVRIFGAGGGGVSSSNFASVYTAKWHSAGGGGGWMNNDILTLSAGINIPITIGIGGQATTIGNMSNASASSGGSSSFGTYLSANGGTGGLLSLKPNNVVAGSGGSGGSAFSQGDAIPAYSGIGYQFGGGGGSTGGNGGVWGGGGGGGGTYGGTYGGGGGSTENNAGIGGTYGGNAGENGTNTIGWTNTETNIYSGQYITGSGLCMNPGNKWYGGGGFGGNGGSYFDWGTWSIGGSGGGGGYGGDGGDTLGGGGGYCSNGGNNVGGGGGYYGNGGSGSVKIANDANMTDGRGYVGGGGGYGDGGTWNIDGKWGGGGGAGTIGNSRFATNGGNGICIIRYYEIVKG